MPTFTQGLRFKFWNRKILINGLYQVNFNEIEKYVAATSQKKLLSVFAIPFYFRGALHIRAWRTKNYVEKNGQFCRFFFENKHDKMSVFFWTDIVNIYVKSLLNKSRKEKLNAFYVKMHIGRKKGKCKNDSIYLSTGNQLNINAWADHQVYCTIILYFGGMA